MSHTRVEISGDGVLRDSVATLLEQARDVEVVGAAADPHVLVTCAAQVSREWLAALDEIRAGRDLPLIAVLETQPTPYLMRVLRRQLEGTVMRDGAAETLIPALAAVRTGQLVEPLAFREGLEWPALSPREKQILAMVVLGLTNSEIAQKLFVTEAAVKAHLTPAFAKLGVRSREDAATVILDPLAGYGPGILRITPGDDQP